CCLVARNHMTGRGPCSAMRLSICERNYASPARAARFSVKHYSELYAFFKTNKSLFTGDERYGVDEHYDEFLIGLKRHTLAPAERNEQAMLERFSYMIDRAKQN
ncbi:hypothetical protein ACTNC4_09810, partial [Collinsella sp. HCP3S3_B8]